MLSVVTEDLLHLPSVEAESEGGTEDGNESLIFCDVCQFSSRILHSNYDQTIICFGRERREMKLKSI